MITFESTIEPNGDVKIRRIETNDAGELILSAIVIDQPSKLIQGGSKTWAEKMIAHLEEGEANRDLVVEETPLAPEDLEVTIIRDEPLQTPEETPSA